MTEENIKEIYNLFNSSADKVCGDDMDKEIGYMKDEYRIYGEYSL
jgi:hypothetical protein